MDSRTTRPRGHLVRSSINVPDFFKSEGFKWKGPGPWVDLGLCPFHKDQRPSLRGNLETGRVRCMACGWSGDPVAFIMQRHGLTFGQAARHLGAWEDLPDLPPSRLAGAVLRGGGR